jgi:hypothetical protein
VPQWSFFGVLVNGCFMATYCAANQEPLVKFGNVPIPVGHGSQDQPFAATDISVIADLHFSGLQPLPLNASDQKERFTGLYSGPSP